MPDKSPALSGTSGDILLLPPAEVARNLQSGAMKFAYAHEGSIVQRVALALQDKPCRPCLPSDHLNPFDSPNRRH